MEKDLVLLKKEIEVSIKWGEISKCWSEVRYGFVLLLVGERKCGVFLRELFICDIVCVCEGVCKRRRVLGWDWGILVVVGIGFNLIVSCFIVLFEYCVIILDVLFYCWGLLFVRSSWYWYLGVFVSDCGEFWC